jgi:uncharacterized protein (TIGR03437 family)
MTTDQWRQTIDINLTGNFLMSPASVTLPVTVTVDDQNAKIYFAGLTPGAAGLHQIDFEVPANVSTGNVNVVVMQNGLTAKTMTLPVSQ